MEPAEHVDPGRATIAVCTRKMWNLFVFLRERWYEPLGAGLQDTLAVTYSPEPGGKEPVAVGLLALATLVIGAP